MFEPFVAAYCKKFAVCYILSILLLFCSGLVDFEGVCCIHAELRNHLFGPRSALREERVLFVPVLVLFDFESFLSSVRSLVHASEI